MYIRSPTSTARDKILAICNCAVGVCNALRTSQLSIHRTCPVLHTRAHVTKENCGHAAAAWEYCPTGAAKLGQKLCTKNGEITYPKQELPDAAKWGPEKWSKDYRDKNQINCYETGTAP